MIFFIQIFFLTPDSWNSYIKTKEWLCCVAVCPKDSGLTLKYTKPPPTRTHRSASINPLDMVGKPWKKACRTDCSSLQVDQGEHPNQSLRPLEIKMSTQLLFEEVDSIILITVNFSGWLMGSGKCSQKPQQHVQDTNMFEKIQVSSYVELDSRSRCLNDRSL